MAGSGQGGFRGDGAVKRAIVLDVKDIKKLIMEKYDVAESDIIKSAYSYTVIMDADESEGKEVDDCTE